MTPNKVINALAERAIMTRMLSSRIRPSGKPGEFLERYATQEQREILKNLKGGDTNNYLQMFMCVCN